MNAMTIEGEVVDTAAAGEGASDEALALAARSDRQAFLLLYDRHVGRVERYITLRIGAPEVEDLVSATFERALSRIHTFSPRRGSFAGWLLAIAHNAVVDRYREGRRTADLDLSELAASGEPGPESVAESHETAEGVRRLLGALSADQRDALALRYGAGLRFAEVGRSLARSESAAKMLVQRGLAALRAGMSEEIER
jgi:RNA polymerase sigma-70 factor (ECF subfamily)